MIQVALSKIIFGCWPIISLNFLTPEITLIRHAEGEHNAAYDAGNPKLGFSIPDPPLTKAGRAQALAAKHQLKGQHFSLVVVSPLTRALETATIIFGDLRVPIVVMPELSEHCGGPNCLLSRIEKLKEKFPSIDFTSLNQAQQNVLFNESEEAFRKRVKKFSSWVKKQGLLKIAVVSHGGFLKELTGRKFANAEIYQLAAYVTQLHQLSLNQQK